MIRATRNNSIISTLIGLVAFAGFGFMVSLVLYKSDLLDEQVQTLKAQRSQEQSFFTLQRISEETKNDRAQLQQYFLESESNSIDFLNQVEALAPEAGVELETSGLDSIIDPLDQSNWIEAKFSVSGSRDRVKQFVGILERLPYVSRIDTIDMTAASKTQWKADITIRVRILSYDA